MGVEGFKGRNKKRRMEVNIMEKAPCEPEVQEEEEEEEGSDSKDEHDHTHCRGFQTREGSSSGASPTQTEDILEKKILLDHLQEIERQIGNRMDEWKKQKKERFDTFAREFKERLNHIDRSFLVLSTTIETEAQTTRQSIGNLDYRLEQLELKVRQSGPFGPEPIVGRSVLESTSLPPY